MSNDKTTAEVKPHLWTDGGDKVLILRRCNPDMTSHSGFRWPESGTVEAPDWSSEPKCGGGLHGWPWGMGLGEGQDYDIIGDKWIVFVALPADVVGELEGGWKCKVRAAEVVYCGSFSAAWAMVNSGRHRLIGAMSAASSGYNSKAASSGYNSKAASSGYNSKAASSGNNSKAASSGNNSKAASSGYNSKAAQSGKSGIAASIGHGGIVQAGELGCIIACEWVESERRYRAVVGYVGENGIEANTQYRAVGGKLVKA